MEVDIIKSKLIKVIGVITLVGMVLPTNLFGYATSDLRYVEKVSSSVNVPSLDLGKNKVESISDNTVSQDIAEVLGMDTNENNTYILVFGEELAKYNIVYKIPDDKSSIEKFEELHEITQAELGNSDIIEINESEESDEDDDLHSEEQEYTDENQDTTEQQEEFVPVITNVDQSSALFEINEPDEYYNSCSVSLAPEDRELLEHLVMGEAGANSVEAAALVAQAIRDTMVYKGFNSVSEVRQALKYSGNINNEPTQEVKDGVSFIFDQGGMAVRHTIFYFYNPAKCSSSFHESQKFIIEFGGHRYFSNN